MFLKQVYKDFLFSLYPHLCLACGNDLFADTDQVCMKCIYELPRTEFENIPLNPVEEIFQGRFPLMSAHSEFHFGKGQVIQTLIHQLKYGGNQEIGKWLGKMLGISLKNTSRFSTLNYLVPVPLNPKREFKRGYNQARLICEGISEILHVPLADSCLVRTAETQTQTRKHRTERWQNVSAGFSLEQDLLLTNKHILLVDDVLTTGATLEACAQVLLSIPGIAISIATVAVASK